MTAWSQNVFSSMVQSVGYNPDTQEMIVQWKNGKATAYQGVPEEEARRGSNEASVGGWLNSEIKGKYRFRNL